MAKAKTKIKDNAKANAKAKTNENKKILIISIAIMAVVLLCIAILLLTGKSKGAESMSNPIVQMEMQDGGKMVFELYPEYAPETVENFVNLAESGFYDGLKFHRIIKGFMAQGGDPKGDGTGGSEKNIKGEFASNGFTKNTLKHTFGVISMARSNDPNSASSQFFIMDGTAESLDGNYAAFGKLIEGENTLRAICDTPVKINSRGEKSLPTKDVIIKKVTVIKK